MMGEAESLRLMTWYLESVFSVFFLEIFDEYNDYDYERKQRASQCH